MWRESGTLTSTLYPITVTHPLTSSSHTEKRDSSRAGGCFDGSSTVITPSGQRNMSDLRVGDEVLTWNDETKSTDFSPVLMFLDRDEKRTHDFFTLLTRSGKSLTLTGSHLVYVKEDGVNDTSEETVTFARKVIPGQWVKSLDTSSHRHVRTVVYDQVVDVIVQSKTGAFAPLTQTGNVIVNQVLASCYANINDQSLAHASFWPVRVSSSIGRFFYSTFTSRDMRNGRRFDTSPTSLPTGIHWYPRLLKWLADLLLPARFID